MKHPANLITAVRIPAAELLLLTPVFSVPFYVFYLCGGLSDMLDGFIARETHSESAFGAKLDSVADVCFTAACLAKILPVLSLPVWLWCWIGAIAAIRIGNLLTGALRGNGMEMLHTKANKLSGPLLFLLPLCLQRIPVLPAAAGICLVCSFAALQEGFLILRQTNE